MLRAWQSCAKLLFCCIKYFKVENLEWATHKENMAHAFTMKSPVRNAVFSILVFLDETKIEFPTFTDVKNFILKENLNTSWASLNIYGKSRGYRLIKNKAK